MAADSALARVTYAAALISCGALARACGGVARSDGAALLRVVFSITLPATLLCTFSSPLAVGAGAGWVLTASVCHATLLGGLSLAWDGLASGQPAEERALLAGASFGVNLGLFAYPFAQYATSCSNRAPRD